MNDQAKELEELFSHKHVSAFEIMMHKKIDDCFNAIHEMLTPYFEDERDSIIFYPSDHMIVLRRHHLEFVRAFVDGAISMYNHMEGFDWVAFDEEDDEEDIADIVYITLELINIKEVNDD